jgi:hypothetical protein
MSPAFSPKVMAPGEGKIVTLFGVRFCYKIVSGDSDGRLAVLEVEIPPKTLVKPHAHSREIQDDWIPELERTYGVKL